MPMLPSTFQANEYETMEDFSPVPAGEYNAIVVESELNLTKKAKEANNPNLGQMLVLKFQILDGEHKGRLVWVRLNIVNSNAQAVEIAQKELATICKAVDLVAIQDSGELHNKPMKIKVSVKEDETGKYGPQNQVKNYKPYEGPEIAVAKTETAAEQAPAKKKAW